MKKCLIFFFLLFFPAFFSAAELPTLTVYSSSSFISSWGPGPKLKAAFEKKVPCQIKYVSFKDSITTYYRLFLEKNNPKADVLVGLDNNQLDEAQSSGLFAKNSFTPQNLNDIIRPFCMPSATQNRSFSWDPQIFVPYDCGHFAFIYDSTKLKNPPKSLKELVENQNISILYQDPRTSSVGRGLLAWINSVFGEQAGAAWEKLAKHTVSVGSGWSETYGAFLKGESDMVLSYETSPLYHQIQEKKSQYKAAIFSEGHILQIELAARLKSSKQPKLAEEFLRFLLTPEAQKIIALNNTMLPVTQISVCPEYDNFSPAKTLDVPHPTKEVSKERIRIWQNSVAK